MEEVKESLFAKDLVDKEFSNDKNSSEVLVVRGKQKNKHSNMICNYCKKRGTLKLIVLNCKIKIKKKLVTMMILLTLVLYKMVFVIYTL